MKRILFDSNWEVKTGGDFIFNSKTTYEPVIIPDDRLRYKKRQPDAPSSFFTGFTKGGIYTYRNLFTAPEEWRGQRVIFEFEGVSVHSEIRVNGNQAYIHHYPYTAYTVDVTRFLRFGEENELTVIAKSDAEPNSRWYVGTGIYRHVWLNLAGQVAFKPWHLHVATPGELSDAPARVAVSAVLENTGAEEAVSVRFEILDADGKPVASCERECAAAAGETKVSAELQIENANLWSHETPYLYQMKAAVLRGGEVADETQTNFGVRYIQVDAERGLRVNGKSVKLKGGCIHHDNGPLGGAAYDRAEVRKVELLMASGFNSIRFSHNPPSPAMLDACDRLGVYTIDEAFDHWTFGKQPYDYHISFNDHWHDDLAAMIDHDFNHPSIIMWSYGNEIWERDGNSDGYEWSAKLANAVRELDPSRPVNMAINWLRDVQVSTMKPSYNMDFMKLREVNLEDDRWGNKTEKFIEPLDVAGYNYLPRRYEYDRKRFPNRVICATETYPLYAYEFWTKCEQFEHVIGDYVWTAFDYIGEAGIGKVVIDQPIEFQSPYPWYLANCGDIDICGHKRPQSYFRDLLWGVRTRPFIAVVDPKLYGHDFQTLPWSWDLVTDNWNYPGCEGKMTRVDVYSIDEEVELVLNGRVVGRKPAGAAAENKVTFDVPYEPGILEAVGYRGGAETGRERLVTPGAPAKLVLTADRAVISRERLDLSYVTVEAEDAAGNRIRNFDRTLRFAVEGCADLAAVGSGDPRTEELFVEPERRAFNGRALAILRSKGEAGSAKLTVSCEGLADATIEITVE